MEDSLDVGRPEHLTINAKRCPAQSMLGALPMWESPGYLRSFLGERKSLSYSTVKILNDLSGAE